MLEHGERIVSLLLQALRQDDRFILLDGRWFLHELAKSPSGDQLVPLAWYLLTLPGPQETEALFAQLEQPIASGDAGLFGLYLALRQRPELFRNTQPGQRPLWQLAGPPLGTFIPKFAAYDPETYEILCRPGEIAQPEVVTRLWQTALLKAVVA